MKEKRLIKKELKKTLKKEQKIIKQDNHFIFEKQTCDIREKINNKLPFDIEKKFTNAFEKSFSTVFNKGIKYIERTYNKQKLMDDFEGDIKKFSYSIKKRNLNASERRVKRKILINQGLSTVEGAAVGFMGILTALADVPIFISVLIKNLNEISLQYGFDYNTESEKIVMLNIISMSISEGENRLMYSQNIDKIGYRIDLGEEIDVQLEEVIQGTSQALAEYMTTAILLQSIPFAGFVFGGLNNFRFTGNLSKVANIKYKKRYLHKMMTEQ